MTAARDRDEFVQTWGLPGDGLHGNTDCSAPTRRSWNRACGRGQRFVEEGLEETSAPGLHGRELRFQPVAQATSSWTLAAM